MAEPDDRGELPDFGRHNFGDLYMIDRGGLGVDFYAKTGDKRLLFLNQGGELALLAFLRQKYPRSRESDNVLLGDRHAGSTG